MRTVNPISVSTFRQMIKYVRDLYLPYGPVIPVQNLHKGNSEIHRSGVHTTIMGRIQMFSAAANGINYF